MFQYLRATIVLFLFALAVFSAACSPAITPLTPTATTAAQPIGASKPALAADQVLRLQLGGEPNTIDPQKSASPLNLGIVTLVFENLLTYDADGKLVPAAAVALPGVSADGLVYTVKLRAGLKYSDGQPLTARDYEFGWKRSLDPAVGYAYAFSSQIVKGGAAYNSADPSKLSKDEMQKLRDAVGVKALDDLTIQFTLEKPAAYFPALLAIWTGLPTREDMIDKGGDKWTEPATFIGNGPFVLKEWQHDVKMVFEANPNYRLGAPTLRRIEYVIVERSAILGYQNNELDGMWVGGANQVMTIQSSPELKQQYFQVVQPGTRYLIFGLARKPFDNVKVRQAFSMAIDRKALVDGIEKGLGAPAEQFVPPGVPGHYLDLKTLKFDPSAAKKLLAEAGYADGKGLPEIKFTFYAGQKPVAEFVQAQIKENLGVEIKLDPVDSRVLGALRRAMDTYPQLSLIPWYQDYPDPQNWYSLVFHSKTVNWHSNHWDNLEFDRLTEQADAEQDAAKRDALYKQAAQLLMDEAPVVFLEHFVGAAVLKPWVRGCQPSAYDNYFLCRASIMQTRIETH